MDKHVLKHEILAFILGLIVGYTLLFLGIRVEISGCVATAISCIYYYSILRKEQKKV